MRVQSTLPTTSTTFCQGLETTFRAHLYPAWKQKTSKWKDWKILNVKMRDAMPTSKTPSGGHEYQTKAYFLQLVYLIFSPVENSYRETFNWNRALFEIIGWFQKTHINTKYLSVGTVLAISKLRGSAQKVPGKLFLRRVFMFCTKFLQSPSNYSPLA